MSEPQGFGEPKDAPGGDFVPVFKHGRGRFQVEAGVNVWPEEPEPKIAAVWQAVLDKIPHAIKKPVTHEEVIAYDESNPCSCPHDDSAQNLTKGSPAFDHLVWSIAQAFNYSDGDFQQTAHFSYMDSIPDETTCTEETVERACPRCKEFISYCYKFYIRLIAFKKKMTIVQQAFKPVEYEGSNGKTETSSFRMFNMCSIYTWVVREGKTKWMKYHRQEEFDYMTQIYTFMAEGMDYIYEHILLLNSLALKYSRSFFFLWMKKREDSMMAKIHKEIEDAQWPDGRPSLEEGKIAQAEMMEHNRKREVALSEGKGKEIDWYHRDKTYLFECSVCKIQIPDMPMMYGQCYGMCTYGSSDGRTIGCGYGSLCDQTRFFVCEGTEIENCGQVCDGCLMRMVSQFKVLELDQYMPREFPTWSTVEDFIPEIKVLHETQLVPYEAKLSQARKFRLRTSEIVF